MHNKMNESEVILLDEIVHDRYTGEKEDRAHTNIDEYGFITDRPTMPTVLASYIKRQWYYLIGMYRERKRKLKSSILKLHLLERGIPLGFKSRIWPILVQEASAAENSAETFKSCIYWPNKYEYQIHVDVQRTYRRHMLFSKAYGMGQTQLFNLLIAISNSSLNIGYCQGMNDICGILLMYFTEDESFCIFKRLVERDSLGSLFENFSKVPEILKRQKRIFLETIPEIYDHIAQNDVDLSINIVPWYLTWFSRFEIKLTLRLWDFFFFYGFNAFLYFTPALFKLVECEILSKSGEELLNFVNDLERISFDEDMVISIGCKFMSKMRGKYLHVI